MKLEVNGVSYENFLSASVEIRLDALSNTFSFAAASTGELPFRGGESCRVLVEDEVVLTGFIEIVSGDYSNGDHNISIQGRDKTGDFLDSSIEAISDIRPELHLQQVIEKIINNIGADISVVDEVNPALFNKAEDLVTPESGDNAFQFVEKLARKRHVLLTSNADGNIVITRASGELINGKIKNLLGDDSNNVISASFSYDTTGRYNIYKFDSSLALVPLNNAGDTKLEDVVDQSGTVTDPDSRIGRQLILVAESPFSSGEDNDRATWEANIRRARGRVYSAVVNGYRDLDGNLWQVNKLVPVQDTYAGIDADMLINTVTFTFDIQNGRQTVMSFVEENAYTLTLEEPKAETIGAGFAG